MDLNEYLYFYLALRNIYLAPTLVVQLRRILSATQLKNVLLLYIHTYVPMCIRDIAVIDRVNIEGFLILQNLPYTNQ